MKKKSEIRDKEFDPFIEEGKKTIKKISIEDSNEKNSNNKISKNKVKRFKFTKFDSFDLLLSVVFLGLLILTIFLGYKVKDTKKNYNEYIRASIVVPVLSKDTNNNISVDIENMKKGDSKSYTFKVANNKDNNINPEEVVYALQLINTENVNVEVYKNDSKENILPESNIILDNKLVADKEQIDTYTLKITAINNTKDKELITIKIVS